MCLVIFIFLFFVVINYYFDRTAYLTYLTCTDIFYRLVNLSKITILGDVFSQQEQLTFPKELFPQLSDVVLDRFLRSDVYQTNDSRPVGCHFF